MYRVVYKNDSTGHYVLIAGPFIDLIDASNARKVSGDIVVDRNDRVVKDLAWLWEWEKKDPKSYAYRQALG